MQGKKKTAWKMSEGRERAGSGARGGRRERRGKDGGGERRTGEKWWGDQLNKLGHPSQDLGVASKLEEIK